MPDRNPTVTINTYSANSHQYYDYIRGVFITTTFTHFESFIFPIADNACSRILSLNYYAQL
jgi:hypothetical protein